ncbi:hypothetical protein D3C76_1511770 [compost metagenome]
MVVHEIQPVFGVFAQPAQCRAPLPGIPRIAICTALHHDPFGGNLETLAKGRGNRLQGRNCRVADGVVLRAAVGHHVIGEKGAAVVDHRLVPLQLIEAFHTQ